MTTVVVGGSASGEIGPNLARALKAEYFRIEKKDFPDGEFVVKVPFDARGKDVVIVQSTYAPQDRHIMELIFIADALKDMHAKSITAVVPYLAYMRQDKRFLNGQVVSAHMIMRLLNASGIGRLVTVQPHKEKPLRLFRGRADSIMPIETLMGRVSRDLSDPYVLAPDIGGLELAKKAARILGCGYTHLDKERDRITGIPRIKNKPHERFDGKQVVIVDDMISTGTTIMLASKFAYSRGATEVVTAAVHLVMADGARHKLLQAGVTRVYGTNTIPAKNSVIVDVSGEIARAFGKKAGRSRKS